MMTEGVGHYLVRVIYEIGGRKRIHMVNISVTRIELEEGHIMSPV